MWGSYLEMNEIISNFIGLTLLGIILFLIGLGLKETWKRVSKAKHLNS
jgi:hypothetical protein